MGLKSRLRAERLPIKLKEIRGKLGLSQNEMLQQIGYEENFDRSTISHYESGEREPPLPILLAYARAANIYRYPKRFVDLSSTNLISRH